MCRRHVQQVEACGASRLLDHLSDGCFEFGIGRGAGSHEILGFLHRDGLTDTSVTKAMWEETIGEFAKMWLNESTWASRANRYHDTFPHPEFVPYWPEPADLDRDALPLLTGAGAVIGDPDDAVEQCRRWEAAGADQLVFGVGTAEKPWMLETIHLMGEHVIPKLDTAPVHRTTRLPDAGAEPTTRLPDAEPNRRT